MRLVIPSALAIILAFQIVYGAFFVSVLDIRASRAAPEAAPNPAAVLREETHRSFNCIIENSDLAGK